MTEAAETHWGVRRLFRTGHCRRSESLKDLAEGLATPGIAVPRYEKRTRQYGEAAALLRTLPEIDGKRVFVIGDSLGGYIALRIAEQDGKLVGMAYWIDLKGYNPTVLDIAAFIRP